MSTLKTHNLQSADSGSVNIALAPNAGMVVTGISTFSNIVDVAGSNSTVRLGNGANRRLMYRSGNNDLILEADSGDFYRQDIANSNHAFFTGNTERLRITSGGSVGINTDVSGNGSGAKLVVGGRIQSNAGGYWFAGANGAEDGWHVQDSSGNLIVVESGVAERLRIKSDGNIGMGGNTNPTNVLHIKTAVTNTAVATIESTATNSYPFLRLKNDAREYQLTCHGGLADAFTIYDGTSSAHRFTIGSGGNVGINEASPDAPLHITGGLPHIRLENSGTSASQNDVFGQIDFKHNDSSDAGVTAAIKCVAEDANGNSFLAFYNGDGGNADERLRIKSDGKVGVNTDGPSQQFTSYAASGYPVLANGPSNGIGLGGNGAIVFGTKDLGSYATGILDASELQLKISGSNRVNLKSSVLLIGNTSSQEVYGTNAVQIQGTSAGASSLSLLRHGNSPYLTLGSSGGSALNSVTALSSGARIGQINFAGADGTDINTHCASISAYVDGSVSSNAVPGRLVFSTSTSTSEDERLRITSAGFVGIGEDDPQTKLDVRGTISTGRNVARELGTIINISANYDGSRVGGNVINGNKNYEAGADWLVNFPANANLTIDLGAAIKCDRFVIYNQNEYDHSNREVKNFTLEGSNDNSSWTTVLDDDCGCSHGHEPNPGFSFRMPAGNIYGVDDEEGVTYRYWKFTMKTFHGSDNYGGVMELELYAHSTTIHSTSEICTHSLVAGDVHTERLDGLKMITGSKGLNIHTGEDASDTWEITPRGIITNGSYQDKSTIRHKGGVIAVSSSYNSGDLFIRIDNIYNLPGNAWWVCGLMILSNEIQGGQGGGHHYVTSLQLMGLSSWNSVSKQDIVGSMSVSVSSHGSNFVELFVNVNDSSRGPCTVICNGGTFDPPRISFH